MKGFDVELEATVQAIRFAHEIGLRCTWRWLGFKHRENIWLLHCTSTILFFHSCSLSSILNPGLPCLVLCYIVPLPSILGPRPNLGCTPPIQPTCIRNHHTRFSTNFFKTKNWTESRNFFFFFSKHAVSLWRDVE